MPMYVGQWFDERLYAALVQLLGKLGLFADTTSREVGVILEVVQWPDGPFFRSITYGGKPTSEFAMLDVLEEMHAQLDCRGMDMGFFETDTWRDAEASYSALLREVDRVLRERRDVHVVLIVRAVVGCNDAASCRRLRDDVWVVDGRSDQTLLDSINPIFVRATTS